MLLEQRSSDLSFDLHRLQFIQLFNSDKADPAPQALAYAQANFLSFQQRHLAGPSPITLKVPYTDCRNRPLDERIMLGQ